MRFQIVRSVRFILTLWYIGILAVVLGVFSWLLYGSVDSSLARDVDRNLQLQAQAVEQAIRSFQTAEVSASGAGPGNWLKSPGHSIKQQIAQGQFRGLVERWVHETKAFEGIRPSRIVDLKGEILDETPGFVSVPDDLMQTALTQALSGSAYYQTFSLPEERVRVVSYPVIEKEEPLYFVQVAASLSHADGSLQRLRFALAFLIPITLCGTSVVGWFLANQALRPVKEMTSLAQKIGTERLDQRVSIPNTDKELQQLARTLNEMLQRLEQDFDRMRQFSSAASHELRTPLTVMKGELEVALRKTRDIEEYKRVLGTQVHMIDELAGIVEDLLLLARRGPGNGALELEPIALSSLAEETIKTFQSLAQRKQVSVRVETEDDAVRVHGDRRLLKRVVSNLLDNALRHTPSGGNVRIRVAGSKQRACLRIEDTGTGIAPEQLPKIFQRFFGSSTRKSGASTNNGFGLGLCRWITEAHNGAIEVANAPEKGAIFTVWLPAC